jgi:hypothetical protein
MDNMDDKLKRMRIEGTPVGETLRQKTRREAARKSRTAKMRWGKPAAFGAAAVAVALAVVMLVSLLPLGAQPLPQDDTAAVAQSDSTATAAPTAQASNAPVLVVAATPAITAVSYISLDINPSIQLTVKEGLVTAAVAYNDDGQGLVLYTNVVGMTPSDALDALVDELIAEGYMSAEEEAALVITVSGYENDGIAEGLKERAQERIREMEMVCSVVSAAVSPDDVAAAQALGLSVGRYLIITYIAEQEGITLEDAIALYSASNMTTLLGMVDDADAIFENDGAVAELINGLTPEQQAVLQAAIDAYKTTVKDAQKTFIDAGKAAQKAFISGKKDAQAAFKQTHDNKAWKQAKTALKDAFYTAKSDAKAAAQAAKAAAKQTFLEAVASLGLSDAQIAQMTAFVFDFDWDAPDFDGIEPGSDESEDKDEGQDDNDRDDDADDDDAVDDDKNDDADGDGDNGKGNDKENPGKGNDKPAKDKDDDEE